MHNAKDVTWSAFYHEFDKIAATAADYARGATLTGGALGLAQGALSGYRQARDEGADLKGSVLAGAKRGVTRGLIGAGIGGLTGHLANRDFNVKLPMLGSHTFNPAKAIHDYGGHQYHILTGRGNASDYGAGKAWVSQMAEGPHKQQALHTWDKIEEKGLTSIPGVAKRLATAPVETAKLIAQGQWHGTRPWEKALMVGMPLGMGALAYKAAPEDQKGQSIGRTIAGTAASMLPFNPGGFAAPMLAPLIGVPSIQGTVAQAADHVGEAAGRAIDRVRGKVVPPQTANGAA